MVKFFAEVAVPCIIIHGVSPSILLYNARHGDFQAIDMLLTIDKRMIGEKWIANHWQQAMGGNNPQLKKVMLRSISKKPTSSISRLKMKYRIGAMVMLTADLFGYPLSMNSLRDGFDYIARDGKSAHIVDPDLPQTDTGFAKGVHRERDSFLKLIGKDYQSWKK